jgi:hypothetical protein
MADLSMPTAVDNTAPSRRLIAAGFIRRSATRAITVRVTEAGVTGVITKQVTR